MKITHLLLALIVSSPLLAQSNLTVPAQDRLQIRYPDRENLSVQLQNRSTKTIEISTVHAVTGAQISGFGLGARAKATLSIGALGVLQIENPHSVDVEVYYTISESAPQKEEEQTYISFTLRNETLKSIPLIIPGVMNPNLSPRSNSGVRLKVGQEINYRKGGKTRTLFTVDQRIEDGDTVLVGELFKKLD